MGGEGRGRFFTSLLAAIFWPPFVLTTPRGIWERRSENASNVFRPHYVGGIWKRNNYRSFWVCVWGKLVLGNNRVIVTPSFSKSSVFKMFSVHTKSNKPTFSNSTGLKSVFEKLRFRAGFIADGRPNRRNKAAFSNFSTVAGCCFLHWLLFRFLRKVIKRSPSDKVIKE